MPESSDLSLMTDRVGKGWFSMLCHGSELIGSGMTWEQRVQAGDPKFEASQNLPDVPYHRFAELIGLKGIFVDRAENVAAGWEEALAADRPVVLEVKTDPNVPPLPPHITFAQAKGFTSTLLTGDPEEGSVLIDTAKEVLSGIL